MSRLPQPWSPHRPPRRSSGLHRAVGVVATALALAVLAAAVGPGSGAGAEGATAKEQRAAVRSQQAEVAAQVDALQGDQQHVAAALAALDENVRGQQAALTDARRQVEASTAEVARAEQAAAATEAEIEALRAKVVAYAVDAYITPPDEDLARRLEAGSAREDATKRAFLELQSGQDADAMDQLRTARQRLDDERARADAARSQAQEAAAAADRALGTLDAARAEQEAFATQVRARLDERLAEAANLSRRDAELGRQVAAEQAALAALVRAVPAAPAKATAAAPASGGPAVVASAAATARRSVPRPALVTVGGITVAASVGDSLRALLAAARADGVFLGGMGWRNSDVQVALRGQNCGWSDYQLYDMPPDQCSPPTARPGSSLHEQGLAVDFSVNGAFIESRSSAAFVWLAANAGRFGFANLPSEPWHWSTTGG